MITGTLNTTKVHKTSLTKSLVASSLLVSKTHHCVKLLIYFGEYYFTSKDVQTECTCFFTFAYLGVEYGTVLNIKLLNIIMKINTTKVLL